MKTLFEEWWTNNYGGPLDGLSIELKRLAEFAWMAGYREATKNKA